MFMIWQRCLYTVLTVQGLQVIQQKLFIWIAALYLLKIFHIFVMVCVASPSCLGEIGNCVFPNNLRSVNIFKYAC